MATVLETPHALVGAAIATKIPNPLIALPLAFASHFVLDMVPHWNPHLNTEIKKQGRISNNTVTMIALDVVLALVLGSFIATNFSDNQFHMTTIFLGAFAGVLPDLVEAPYYFFKIKSEFSDRWIKFQKSIQADTTVVPGIATQIATIIAALWWVAS